MINEIDYLKQSIISNITIANDKMNKPNKSFDELFKMSLEDLEQIRDAKVKEWNLFIQNPIPYINLNGNDKKTIIDEMCKTAQIVRNASKELCKMQMFHGRNATDLKHMDRLRNKKLALNKSLWDIIEYLEYVAIVLYSEK
tara:strand:- start:2560 stop:2982 length:423 start_codon:yes stop_codon:yes gene_type:complete